MAGERVPGRPSAAAHAGFAPGGHGPCRDIGTLGAPATGPLAGAGNSVVLNFLRCSVLVLPGVVAVWLVWMGLSLVRSPSTENPAPPVAETPPPPHDGLRQTHLASADSRSKLPSGPEKTPSTVTGSPPPPVAPAGDSHTSAKTPPPPPAVVQPSKPPAKRLVGQPLLERWEIHCAATSFEAYARQLDALPIELAAWEDGGAAVDYAVHFQKPKPDHRTESPDVEDRMYRGGEGPHRCGLRWRPAGEPGKRKARSRRVGDDQCRSAGGDPTRRVG